MPTTEDETKEQEENDCIKVIGNELLFYGGCRQGKYY